jgi:hypothetical protein
MNREFILTEQELLKAKTGSKFGRQPVSWPATLAAAWEAAASLSLARGFIAGGAIVFKPPIAPMKSQILIMSDLGAAAHL